MVVAESPFFGCEILFFWLRNRLFLVAESSFFGWGIVFFWLRKRLFLVAEVAEIWLWKRRNMVSESEFIL